MEVYMILNSNNRCYEYQNQGSRQINSWHLKLYQEHTQVLKNSVDWRPLLIWESSPIETLDLPSSVQFASVTQSSSTLCNPMNCSTSGLPVHHQLREFTQTHVHWVGDAIQPSHPLSSPSPPDPNSLPASESFPMSQLFTWGGQSTGVSALASVLPKNTQDWSPLKWTGWISLQSMRLARVFSNTTVQKRQFFSTQLSL